MRDSMIFALVAVSSAIGYTRCALAGEATPRQLRDMEMRQTPTSGCTWSYDDQKITCSQHQFYDPLSEKWEPVTFSTAAFPRPNCGGKVPQKDCKPDHEDYDPKTHYAHTDTRPGLPFNYLFNIGEDIEMSDPIVAKDKCEKTTGDDNKTLTGPAAGFQTDGKRDFNCHRIAGSVKKEGNVRVGLLDDRDPTKGYYFTVAGGDDCSEGRDSNAYQSRSLTVVVRCNLESEAIGKVPEIEEVVEGYNCLYMITLESSHGCPLSCEPAKLEFSGGAYPPPCNAPAGRCELGRKLGEKSCPAEQKEFCVGKPQCVCDDTGGRGGYFGPACDKQCTAEGCGDHGHCAYDAIMKKARCFCNDGYDGDKCENAAPTGGSGSTTVVANGANVFAWILFAGVFCSIVGLFMYHKREMGEPLCGGSSDGGTGNSGYSNL